MWGGTTASLSRRHNYLFYTVCGEPAVGYAEITFIERGLTTGSQWAHEFGNWPETGAWSSANAYLSPHVGQQLGRCFTARWRCSCLPCSLGRPPARAGLRLPPPTPGRGATGALRQRAAAGAGPGTLRSASVLVPASTNHQSVRPRTPTETVACPRAIIYLDTHMLHGVYQESGICVRSHCGAEPPRDIEPAGLVTTVGGRDRASTSYAAADRVKAPASAARGRFRGIHGGRTAPSLPAET